MTKIERVKNSDLWRIEEIEKRRFKYLLPPGTFLTAVDDPSAIFIKAVHDGILTAYLLATATDYEAEMVEIATDESYENQGYGHRLLTEFESMAKEKEYIYLEVRRSNVRAIDLYLASGYEIYNFRKRYYRDLEDAVLMRKKLKV